MTDSVPPIRVLLVEDSADDAELVTRALRGGGMAVEARVAAGEAAFRAELAAFSPELILADWRLPGFSGAAAVTIAHAWDPAVPCILVSGTLGEELVVEALRTGATDYILKQRLQGLVPAVRRALAEAAERGARIRLEAELGATQAALRGSLDAMADPFVICTAIRDDVGAIVDFRITFANLAAATLMSGRTSDLIDHHGFRASMGALGAQLFGACVGVTETGQAHSEDGIALARAPSTDSVTAVIVDLTIAPFDDGCFLLFRDVTERSAASKALHDSDQRFRQFFERTPDYAYMVSIDGRLIDVNAAALEALGYAHDELVGLQVDTIYAPESRDQMAALFEGWAAGGPVSNLEQTLLTRAGGRRTVLLSASLVRDGTGRPLYFLGVQRDVTDLREAQADAELEARIRIVLAESMHAIPEQASIPEAAQAICDQLVALPHVDTATVQVFLGAGDVEIIAQSAPPGYPVPVGTRLPPIRAAIVRERAAVGPWAEYVSPDPAAGWIPGTVAIGLKALAFGPIRHGDHVEGVLLLGTSDGRFARTLVEKMPGIVSFSTTLSALLAKRLHALRLEADLRARLVTVLATTAFHLVFQPIVDLKSGEVVGHEALTRFDSGERPDVVFADAWSVGLGPDLELATLEAAVADARRLAPGAWLDLNVSPRLLGDGAPLARILLSADRALVLEVTEHEVIDDYDRVREAIRALGRDIRLAVDDAGAGVANFGHIIDLHPDFVKLDISLVRRVNANLGRQAMVVGMRHFSRTAGCRLIAEGVETAEEASTLTALGVEFGQGYLFGRPEPVDVWASAGHRARGARKVDRAAPRVPVQPAGRARLGEGGTKRPNHSAGLDGPDRPVGRVRRAPSDAR
jgi:PAS domain S-box-containing protein